MFTHILSAVVLLLSALSANAATYRIEVTGAFVEGRVEFPWVTDLRGERLDPVTFTLEEYFSRVGLPPPGDFFGTTGSFIYERGNSGRISDCRGMFRFCDFVVVSELAFDLVAQQFWLTAVAEAGCCILEIRETGADYRDDALRDFEMDGVVYRNSGGDDYYYTLRFDSVSVSVVPVPAAGLFGLTGLAGLAALRLARKGRRAGRR